MFKTIRQTANLLGVPEYLIRFLVERGVCPGVYSWNRLLVHVEALREYLDAESRKAVEAKQ